MEFHIKAGNDEVVNKTRPINSANLDLKIVKQLEFYFSDINLPSDYFLQRQIKQDNGWVKISTLLTFNMLKSISKDPVIIAAAITNHTNSILEVDKTNKKIRRKPDNTIPVADQKFLDDVIDRSIHCTGFPKTATVDDILKYAASFGDKVIIKVTPQRLISKKFNGSLFFTFNKKEQAEYFLKQKSLKYNNFEIERTWEKDFRKIHNNF